MALEKLKQDVQEILNPIEVQLLDVKWEQQGGDRILQFTINHSNGVNVDLCVEVTHLITETVDAFVDGDDQFYLEVTSSGAEQPFSSYEELQTGIGTWVHFKLKDPVAGNHIYEGELIEADNDGNIVLSYRDKARSKNLEITFEQIAFARRAVKI